jgi:hypothetical protein
MRAALFLLDIMHDNANTLLNKADIPSLLVAETTDFMYFSEAASEQFIASTALVVIDVHVNPVASIYAAQFCIHMF